MKTIRIATTEKKPIEMNNPESSGALTTKPGVKALIAYPGVITEENPRASRISRIAPMNSNPLSPPT